LHEKRRQVAALQSASRKILTVKSELQSHLRNPWLFPAIRFNDLRFNDATPLLAEKAGDQTVRGAF
jgi:hypothetical protein